MSVFIEECAEVTREQLEALLEAVERAPTRTIVWSLGQLEPRSWIRERFLDVPFPEAATDPFGMEA